MAYEIEKSTGDIVVNGFSQGIAPSPHKGIANIQNANLSTETGEVINSFVRVQDTMTSSATGTGTLAFVDSSHVALNIAGSNNLFKGNWISVTNSSNTAELPNGTYYVSPSTGANFQLSQYYNTLLNAGGNATYLIVGGGGGGGGGDASPAIAGSGGGAGQVKAGTAALTVGTFPVTIGTGGAGGTLNNSGSAGNSSSALSVTAAAGQGGNQGGSSPNKGGTSGSGETGGTGGTSGSQGGGGGGGDSAIGGNFSTTSGGAGGAGTANTITGSSVTYGGGGGGAGEAGGAIGIGGTGGGGAGANNSAAAVPGAANTGGGGGGGTNAVNTSGASGGSGIVIIAFPTGAYFGVTGGVITYTDTMEVHTFTSSGSLIVPAQPSASPLTGFTTGLTATIQLVANMGKPIASATETYLSNGVVYNRYYVLDNQNLVWVYDTKNETLYSSSDNVSWFLPDYQTNWCIAASGIAVISGFLVVAAATGIYGKSVSLLGNTNSQATTWTQFHDIQGWNGSSNNINIPHFCYVGHQGSLYITDAVYIAEVFPDSTLAASGVTNSNIQTFCSWTVGANQFTGNFSIISGTSPETADSLRLPVVFFTENGGALPSSISAGTVYYIQSTPSTFQVFSAASGGSALDIEAGAYGPQYFNSFYPIATNSAFDGSTPTFDFTNQRLGLPTFEIAQCMTEVGNNILIGCLGNTIYPWNQQDPTPSSLIFLPESNVVSILTVNQMAYILAGNKGNVYITDGSVASLVTTVPDYASGVPGNPLSYIEPYFIWGTTMYLRGRIYFSIFDQTATKAGNCGGIWSFVPTQNFYIGQDVGIQLHLENQNSYGTYNGAATVLIPKVNQQAIAPQYFSGWYSSLSSPTYGIDATGTAPGTPTILEIDIIPTGTMLDKKSFSQIEFKLATPLLTADSVTFNYRKNLTSVWTSCGTVQLQNDKLSGYVNANFEKTQWLQLQVLLNSGGDFIRLTEIRIR